MPARPRTAAGRRGTGTGGLIRLNGRDGCGRGHPSVVLSGPMARRRFKLDQRRALKLLAVSRNGCTEAVMLAHGFPVPLVVELVRAGLATATAEHMVAGNKTIEIATVRITEAGRRTLAQ